MDCPQCGTRTEVTEKRGPFRERRCTGAPCLLEFTTREQLMKPRKQMIKQGEHGRLCARTRHTQFELYPRFPNIACEGGATSCPAPAAFADIVEVRAAQVGRPDQMAEGAA
jgi:hypothetical protein